MNIAFAISMCVNVILLIVAEVRWADLRYNEQQARKYKRLYHENLDEYALLLDKFHKEHGHGDKNS